MISSLLLAALIKLPPVECKRADFHGFILWITADHLQASKHKTTWLSGKKETGANGKPLRNGREETFTPLFGDYGVLLHFFTESNNVEYLHSNQLKAVSSVFPVLWLQVFHSGKKKVPTEIYEIDHVTGMSFRPIGYQRLFNHLLVLLQLFLKQQLILNPLQRKEMIFLSFKLFNYSLF